jgi:hypothetical protein
MARLVHVDRVLPLTGDLVLGRHRECGLRVDDDKASRQHARVFRDGDAWWIEDLESANGTVLNGKPVEGRVRLGHDDCIAIGKSRILFQDADAPPSSPPIGSERRSAAAVGVVGNPSLLLGRVICGFRLDAVLAKSPLGALYRAHQMAMARDVAFKGITPEAVVGNAGFADRLLAATQRAGALHHPGIVRIHECGWDEELGLLWYAMEFVEGETLARLIAREGRLAPGQALLIIERIAQALAVAHDAGVLHGDLKLANVMVSVSGEVRILELGLAEALALGRDGDRLDDHAFRAPELAAGAPPDARSDIYALGCVLWYLLAGEPPFPGADAAALAKAHREQPVPATRGLDARLPARLDGLVQGMLNKNPEWRFANLGEVLTELDAVRDALSATSAPAMPARPPVAAVSAPAAERLALRADRARLARIKGVATGAAWMVGIGLAAWWLWSQPFMHRAPLASAEADGPAAGVPAPAPVARVADPIAGRDVPPPAPPTPPPDQLAERWRVVQAEAEADVREGSWGSAERQLREFAATPGLSPDLVNAVRLAQGRLQVEGETWYQAELAKLHGLAPSAALVRLGVLRDVVIAVHRGDAEARYQEAQARLLQRLQAARRQARQRLEAGKASELSGLAAALAGDFAGTPIVGMHRQFVTLAAEAARSARLWRGTWPMTRAALATATGEDALAAGAALLLAGDVEGAKRVLATPDLASGELLRRREALLGREAAVLAFSDPADLQFIETTLGEPVFAEGALTGTPGDACGVACTVAIGGSEWDASLVLELADAPGAEAQASIACVSDRLPELSLQLVGDLLTIRVHASDGWQEQQSERPTTAPLRLRLACRGGKLQVMVNGQAVMEVEHARIPGGSRLALDVGGARWKLDELQVVGGG